MIVRKELEELDPGTIVLHQERVDLLSLKIRPVSWVDASLEDKIAMHILITASQNCDDVYDLPSYTAFR